MFDLLPFIFPSFLVTMETFDKRKRIKEKRKNYQNNISLSWSLDICNKRSSFCRTHCKTCWTMIVDNVGLKLGLLGTSSSMITLTSFPWSKPKWSRDKFNNQSHILEEQGTIHDPQCQQPLRAGIHHGSWTSPRALKERWLVVELVPWRSRSPKDIFKA